MTFSEYIIKERSEKFYFVSLIHISKSKTTLEQWFSDMYADYKILFK